VRVLDCESVVLDGVRFLGATLWTDFRATGNAVFAQFEARRHMTDYRRIRAGGQRSLRPSDTVAEHNRARAFLSECLAQRFDGPTVVVTHHAPSPRSLAPQFRQLHAHVNAAYVSDLEGMMHPGVALWIHGHTHRTYDYRLGATRVLCNPRGYVPFAPVPGFDPALIVSV
jgi:hypothetical protein